MKISAEKSKGRSITEAVWLTIVGLAAASSAQAKTDEKPEQAGQKAGVTLVESSVEEVAAESQVAASPVVDAEVPENVSVAVQPSAAGPQGLEGVIESYLNDATLPALGEGFTKVSSDEIIPQSGIIQSMGADKGYQVAQTGGTAAGGGVAAMAPETIALLALGGVGLIAAASGGSDSPPAPAPIAGVAIDGYVAGATVFYDADDDGVQDAGEASTTTDASGNFSLVAPAGGKIVITGGTDVLTGKAFAGKMVAESTGADVVVSPFTTLLATGAIDEAKLKEVLGLSEDIDLTTFDPIAAMTSGSGAANGEAVLIAAQQLVAVVSALVAAGIDANPEDAVNALAESLAATTSGGLAAATTAAFDGDPRADAVNAVNAKIEDDLGDGQLSGALAGSSVNALVEALQVVVLAQTTFLDDVADDNVAGYTNPATLQGLVDDSFLELSPETYDFLTGEGLDDFTGTTGIEITDQEVLDSLVASGDDAEFEEIKLDDTALDTTDLDSGVVVVDPGTY